jgi:hypothetical protein
MSTIDRTGTVSFSDASLSVWEEGISAARQAGGREGEKTWERDFKRDVFARIVQQLNRLGWECVQPAIKEHDVKHYGGNVARWSTERHRNCRKGDLIGELEISGRCIKFEMWQSVNTPNRPEHGGRYESNKEAVMPYVLWLEMERTRRRIRDYLCGVMEGYTFEPPKPKMGFYGVTALEYAAHTRRTSVHYVAELDRAKISNPGQDISADGNKLENGTRVYAQAWHGRMVTGIAFYDLNGYWQIVTGRYGLERSYHNRIWVDNPGNLRMRRDTGQRRKRLESELSKAMKGMDFERAAVLRDILFPKEEQLYVVHHKEHDAYHRAGFCGYTNNLIDAGKFTAAEVEGWAKEPNEVIPLKEAA